MACVGRKQVRTPMGGDWHRANRHRYKIEEAIDEGTYEAPRNIAFSEWADRWRAGLACKPSTRDSYLCTMDWAKRAFGQKPVRRITLDDVRGLTVPDARGGIV